MLIELKTQLENLIQNSIQGIFSQVQTPPLVEIEVPADKTHGDFSTNIALKSSRLLGKSPLDLATQIQALVNEALAVSALKEKVERIEIKRPGFINFYLSANAGYDILSQVFDQNENFGRLRIGAGKKVQIEFVSANPTGPLSVAHARQAAVGDALGNILKFVGYDVVKEYYVNDEGNQINILGKSIQLRAFEILGEAVTFPEDFYQGEYIKDMANEFLKEKGLRDLVAAKAVAYEDYRKYALDYLLVVINKELDDFGVFFDVWTYQSEVATPERIEALLKDFQARGHVYSQDGALWFRSTAFGDDKDRVVKKSDGNYTYFTPDIVYHQDKFNRGFERVVNLWGPDHHGYIPRLTAAVEALGRTREALYVIIVQLATIFRDGKPVSMSTRRGQYISLREVMEEVGVDAARFFFLMRHTNAHLEFDLDLAKKAAPENPVFYVQYAHARIHSVLTKAQESSLFPKREHIALLSEPEEKDLIKKIGEFPGVLTLCGQQMDPFALVVYLQELATVLHKFYDIHRVIDPQTPALSSERLALMDAARIVFANGLKLLGVHAPAKM